MIGASFAIDGKTVRHAIDLLNGLCLVRRLPAWSRAAGQQLAKAAEVYWRDTGPLHMPVGLHGLEERFGHPLCGHSWTADSVEKILSVLPRRAGESLPHARKGGISKASPL